MIRLTRKYRFTAAHRLHTPALSDEENRATYGRCNNPHGHGHNYEVEVTVCGPVDPVTGRMVEITTLDALAHDEILTPFGHRNLNEMAAFQDAVPTTENLSAEFDRRLKAAWSQFFPSGVPWLEKVRISETDRNICEIAARA